MTMSSSVKIVTTPMHDSDNSEPSEVTFSESLQGNVFIELQNPRRTLTIKKEDFKDVLKILG